jgi:hypothetical protein
MSARIAKKLLSVVLLVAITTLAAYTMDSHPTPVKFAADNRETINVAPYIYGKTPPFSLGAIKNPDAYVHIKLRFRAESTEGYPNVFQTAPVNRGMRMEISGSTAAIVVHDLEVPSGLKGLTLTTALKIGQWHELEVEALNGKYVRVKLDGQDAAAYAGAGLSMETTQLLVGGGFDASRAFRGQIENISVTKGNLPEAWVSLPYSISLSQWMLIFLCGIAFLMSLPRGGPIAEIADMDDAKPTTSDLVDDIAMYGLSLVFVTMGLFSIYLFGEQYLGLSKWLAHMMLPVSLGAILLVIKQQRYVWKWARWPLGIIFLAYAAFIVGSIGYKEHAYDAFILSMFIFSPLAFYLPLARTGLGESLPQSGRMRLASGVEIVISGLFLALSWSALVDLTNWQAFRLAFDNNFGVSVVGAFLVLRAVFAVLFEPPNTVEVFGLSLSGRGKVKYLLNPVYLDVAVIAVFFWFSFRQDSLFVPGSEYHWEYYVGVVQGIRNGGWLLWDTPSQYGFLNILLASLVPSVSAWQSFYIFQGTLLFLVSTGIYLAARRYTSTSLFHRLAIFTIIFMALFFADPECVGPYPFPSSSVVRFFCVYALVLVAWFIPKFGLRQAIALSIVWSLAVIWSAESAIYATAIFLFNLIALLQTRTTENHCFVLAGKYVAIAAMCLATLLVILFAFYFARLGVAPDLFGFFEHAVGYAGGFGYVLFPLSGPGNLLLLVFMGISILCIGVIQREGNANENTVSPLAAMAGCIWGISTYYIGRPVPQNITAMLPLIAMVVYLSLVLSKRTNMGRYSLPIKAAALPLFFLILIPLFTPKWVENLFQIQSFSSDIRTKLPKASDELRQLLSRAEPSAGTPIVYYGDDAAPPILSGDYAKFNGSNWLPIPLQLLETPVSEARRSLYLHRYICRNQPSGGILVNRKGDAIEVRLQGFLRELRQFYDVEEIISGNVYTLYRFSGMNLQHCPAAVWKKHHDD